MALGMCSLERLLPQVPREACPISGTLRSSGPVRVWIHRRWCLPHITCLRMEAALLSDLQYSGKHFLGLRVVNTWVKFTARVPDTMTCVVHRSCSRGKEEVFLTLTVPPTVCSPPVTQGAQGLQDVDLAPPFSPPAPSGALCSQHDSAGSCVCL